MKLIIEVDKEDLDFIRKTFTQDAHDYIPMVIRNCFVDAVLNGTPIPDNATNGDVIKAMFEPNRVERTDDDVIVEHYDFSEDWWDAPYKGK